MSSSSVRKYLSKYIPDGLKASLMSQIPSVMEGLTTEQLLSLLIDNRVQVYKWIEQNEDLRKSILLKLRELLMHLGIHRPVVLAESDQNLMELLKKILIDHDGEILKIWKSCQHEHQNRTKAIALCFVKKLKNNQIRPTASLAQTIVDLLKRKVSGADNGTTATATATPTAALTDSEDSEDSPGSGSDIVSSDESSPEPENPTSPRSFLSEQEDDTDATSHSDHDQA